MSASVRLQLASFILLAAAATASAATIAIASASAAETTTTTTTTSETQPVSQVSDPQYSLSVPATTRSEALMKARLGAGRLDPFAPTSGVSPILPLNPAEIKPLKTVSKVHLPPPPKFSSSELVPPPPGVVSLPGTAGEAVGSAGMGSSENDLPEPPEKPTIADKMKLVGLVDNKAFFTFTDLELRRANKFPSTVILASGEQFESVHLVSLDKNSVVLEEDGERITKELERIR
jgi:hypothetical protein